MKIEDVNWEEAKKVVKVEKLKWYEDYDEAEGLFMGWRKIKSNKPVPFKEFIKWWEPRSKNSL